MSNIREVLRFSNPLSVGRSQEMDINGYGTVIITVIGTGFTGTLQIQALDEEGKWYNLRYAPIVGNADLSTEVDNIELTLDSIRRRYLITEPVEEISVNKLVQSAGILARVYINAKEFAFPFGNFG